MVIPIEKTFIKLKIMVDYTRYVLGDWHNAPSYIIFKNNKIQLCDI